MRWEPTPHFLPLWQCTGVIVRFGSSRITFWFCFRDLSESELCFVCIRAYVLRAAFVSVLRHGHVRFLFQKCPFSLALVVRWTASPFCLTYWFWGFVLSSSNSKTSWIFTQMEKVNPLSARVVQSLTTCSRELSLSVPCWVGRSSCPERSLSPNPMPPHRDTLQNLKIMIYSLINWLSCMDPRYTSPS